MYGKLTNIPLKLLPKGEDVFVFHMDIYAKVKYNSPEQLSEMINKAFCTAQENK